MMFLALAAQADGNSATDLCSYVSQRDSTTLIIRTAAGPLVYRDHLEPDESYISYILSTWFSELDLVVLNASYWEGSSYFTVDLNTGDEYRMISVPLPNPSGSLLLCYNVDLVAQYSANGFRIWEATEKGLHVEYELLDTMDWGPADAFWMNDSTVSFTEHEYTDEYDLLERPMLLLQRNNEWQIKPPVLTD